MGNAWFGKKKRSSKGVVLPVGEGVRIKVRMRRGQFEDLIEKVDMSKGDSELGRLIVQECSKGRLHARIVADADAAAGNGSEEAKMYAKGWGLRPIQEHSDE